MSKSCGDVGDHCVVAELSTTRNTQGRTVLLVQHGSFFLKMVGKARCLDEGGRDTAITTLSPLLVVAL